MIDKLVDFKQQNQLVKALNRTALIIFITRLIFAVILAFIQFWGLASYALFSVLIWIWIYEKTGKEYRTSTFVIGVVESIVYYILSIFFLGWNCGVYFSLIALLPVIMINSTIKRESRFLLGSLMIVILAGMFVLLQILRIPPLISPNIQSGFFALNLIQGCVILITVAYTIEKEKMLSEAEIVDTNQKLLTLANTDPLTNLLNRRIMMTRIEEEKEKVDKGGASFSLLMIDVDNFKQINDEFGHDGGDFVLGLLAEKLKLGVRKNDLISRWGGDEFLVMLIETDPENGRMVAEKIRSHVENSPFIYHEINIPVTITLGISDCDNEKSISSCLRKADLALYKGKQEGKNRSIWY